MGQNRQVAHRRLALAALACVVVACSAAPVMADPAEPPASSEEEVLQASEFPVPTFADINDAYLASKRKEEERERELQGPAFAAERERSRHAYAGVTSEEAEELLRSTFAGILSRLNAEPARVLSDAKLDENLGNGSAVITSEGRKEILEAGLPIEAQSAEGEMEKVDVGLEQGPEGFEPENPLVELTIGNSAEEGVEVGGEGAAERLAITQAGAEESPGHLLGDKNVFFGEVEEGSDTDLMVSPTSRGVELFDMLRSADSPETLQFDLELPEGDTVRAAESGGAEIVDPEGSIEVGAQNVAHVREILTGIVGTSVPLNVQYAPGDGEFDGRYRTKGKMLAGDEIQSAAHERCTAGPGASKSGGTKPNGEALKGTKFLLTAGHCVAVGENIYRGVSEAAKDEGQVKIGHGARTGLPRTGGNETDGSAVSLDNQNIIPAAIYRPNRQVLAVGSPEPINLGDDLCFSGFKTDQIKCGPVLSFHPWHPIRKAQEPAGSVGVLISAEMGKPFQTESGDSGGPVWDAMTKAIVGVISGSRLNGRTVVAPLLQLPLKNAANRAPGILAAVGGDLTIEASE